MRRMLKGTARSNKMSRIRLCKIIKKTEVMGLRVFPLTQSSWEKSTKTQTAWRMESMTNSQSSSKSTILNCRQSSKMMSSSVQLRWAIRLKILPQDKTTEMDINHNNNRTHHSNPSNSLHTSKLRSSNSSRCSSNNSNPKSRLSTTWWTSIFSRQRAIIDFSMKTRAYF